MKTDSYNGKNVRDLSSIFSAKAEKMAEELLASKSGKSFSQFLGNAGSTLKSTGSDSVKADKVSAAGLSYKRDVTNGRTVSVKTGENDNFQGGSDRVVKESGSDGVKRGSCSDGSGKKEKAVAVNDRKQDTPSVKDPDRREMAGETAEAVSKISKTLKEELDVTDEDIFEAMEVLGLSLADLFNPNDLKQLFIELSGSEDSMALLTDATLYDGMVKLLTFADDMSENILKDFTITEDDFRMVLDELAEIADYGMPVSRIDLSEMADSLQLSSDNQMPDMPDMPNMTDAELSAKVILKDDGNGAVLQQAALSQGESIKGSDILADETDELSRELTDGKQSAAADAFASDDGLMADAETVLLSTDDVKTGFVQDKNAAGTPDDAAVLAAPDSEEADIKNDLQKTDTLPKVEIEGERLVVKNNPYQRKAKVELPVSEDEKTVSETADDKADTVADVKTVPKNDAGAGSSDNKNSFSDTQGEKPDETVLKEKDNDETVRLSDNRAGASQEVSKGNSGTHEEHSVKVTETGVSNKADAAPLNNLFQPVVNNIQELVRIKEDVFSGYTDVRQAREIAKQIAMQVKVNANAETTSMELELNPASLGHLSLNIEQKNGMVTASFITQNEAVRDAIAGQLQVLKDSMEEQGIKVEAVEVTVESHAFEQNSSQNGNPDSQELARREIEKSARHRRIVRLLAGGVFDSGSSEGDGVQVDMMRRGGNSMDILA